LRTDLRRTFGPKRDEVIGVSRRLHNEELLNLYSSPNIIMMIKSRRIWAGHVACKGGGIRNVYKILVGKPEGKSRRLWNGFIWLRIGTSDGLL
jgi:hypothetical protein